MKAALIFTVTVPEPLHIRLKRVRNSARRDPNSSGVRNSANFYWRCSGSFKGSRIAAGRVGDVDPNLVIAVGGVATPPLLLEKSVGLVGIFAKI